MPKVIDFGVAKATNQRLTEETIYTQHGMMIGTPEYMSPEQAEMSVLDIDTRTDIYSLGVLLYELLVGERPFESRRLREATHDEMKRIIREEDAETPSTRLASLDESADTVALRRRTDIGTLRRRVRGDLDWVVMKALDKDRGRRYASAAELAADVRRHLADEPVLASPPSSAYRIGKFVRRHRFGVLAAGAVLVVLLAGLWASTTMYLRAEQQRARAEAVIDFIKSDLLAAARPGELGRDATIREVLDVAAGGIGDRFVEQPWIEATIRDTLGTTYYSLGEYALAEEHLRAAHRTLVGQLGPEHPESLSVQMNLSIAVYRQNKLEAARELQQEVVDARTERLGREHPETLQAMHNLANTLSTQQELDAARALQEEILEVRERTLGSDHATTLATKGSLAITWRRQGDMSGALRLEEEILAVQLRTLGREDPSTLRTMASLGATRQMAGDLPAAREIQEEVVELRRQVLGPEHPDTVTSMGSLAVTLRSLGEFEAAKDLYEEAWRLNTRVVGPEHPETLRTMGNLANLLKAMGDPSGARGIEAEVLDTKRRVYGPDHRSTVLTMGNMAITLYMLDDREGAAALFEEVLAVNRRTLGEDHPQTLRAMANLGQTVAELGELERGRELLEGAIAGYLPTLGPEHNSTTNAISELAAVLEMQGDTEGAEAQIQRLCWLLERDEATLASQQRGIRSQIADRCS